MKTDIAKDAYIAQAQARQLSHDTISIYRWGVSHIKADDLPTRPEEIEAILAEASQRLAEESVYNVWRYLGMFFRWAADRYDIPDPTVKVAAPRRPKLLPRNLSPEQVEALFDACNDSSNFERDRLLVLVPLNTGLRRGEVAAMKKDDLRESVRLLGKGRKERYVPISPSLADELREIGNQKYIWTTDEGGRLAERGVEAAYTRIFDRANVPEGPHSLRHTFATNYLRAGGDIYRLSRILGHSSVTVTQRYLHLLHDDLIEEHRLISPAKRYLHSGDDHVIQEPTSSNPPCPTCHRR